MVVKLLGNERAKAFDSGYELKRVLYFELRPQVTVTPLRGKTSVNYWKPSYGKFVVIYF